MGSSQSKKPSYAEQINDEISRKLQLQRELQLAIQMARARDTLSIFGTAWATFTSGIVMSHIVRRPPPALLHIPVVVGALALGNMADMAYGNKLQRIVREAEYILDHESGRMVPPHQASFWKFYSEQQREQYPAPAVGETWPWYRARSSAAGKQETKVQ